MDSWQRILSTLALALAVVVAPQHARAQSTVSPYPACEHEPTERDVVAAKGAFEAGEVSFHEADYARATLYWEDAFRRDCTAVKLLLNLARAYELSGHLEQAILALETYLERRPDAPDQSSMQKRIATLRKQVHAEQKAATPAADAPTTQPAIPAQQPTPTAPETGPSEQQARPGRKRPWWPIVLTGVGVVTVGIGAGISIDGQSTLNNVQCEAPTMADSDTRQCVNQTEVDRAQAAQSQRNAGTGVAIAGGALAVAGTAIWLILWNKDDTDGDRPSTSFLPQVTPSYAGVSYALEF